MDKFYKDSNTFGCFLIKTSSAAFILQLAFYEPSIVSANMPSSEPPGRWKRIKPIFTLCGNFPLCGTSNVPHKYFQPDTIKQLTAPHLNVIYAAYRSYQQPTFIF